MHRIDNPEAVASLPIPKQTGTPGYFTNGNPNAGLAPTVVDDDWMNSVQEEISYVIEAAGLTLSKVDRTQLFQALQRLTRTRLAADTTYYLSPNGNDGNDGLTPASPWASIVHGYNFVRDRLDLNGHVVTLKLADGTYGGADLGNAVVGPPVHILGNPGSPINVRIMGSAASQAGLRVSEGARIIADSVTVGASGSPGPYQPVGNGLYAVGPSVIYAANMIFDACSAAHIATDLGGVVGVLGLGASYTIIGGAPYHALIERASLVGMGGASIVISGTPTFSGAFLNVMQASQADFTSVVFTGGAHGKRYAVALSGLINTGTGDPNFLPGDIAGTVDTATGGIYA